MDELQKPCDHDPSQYGQEQLQPFNQDLRPKMLVFSQDDSRPISILLIETQENSIEIENLTLNSFLFVIHDAILDHKDRCRYDLIFC
jgi:hypothetical protein